jgi:hypothetical protein
MCQKLGPPRVKQKNEGEKERFNVKSMEQAAPSLRKCNAATGKRIRELPIKNIKLS